jgi:hypothetical protein
MAITNTTTIPTTRATLFNAYLACTGCTTGVYAPHSAIRASAMATASTHGTASPQGRVEVLGPRSCAGVVWVIAAVLPVVPIPLTGTSRYLAHKN